APTTSGWCATFWPFRSWLRSCRPGTAVHQVERPQRSQQLPQLAGPRVIKIPIPLAGPRSGIGLPGVLVAVLTGRTLLLVGAVGVFPSGGIAVVAPEPRRIGWPGLCRGWVGWEAGLRTPAGGDTRR